MTEYQIQKAAEIQLALDELHLKHDSALLAAVMANHAAQLYRALISVGKETPGSVGKIFAFLLLSAVEKQEEPARIITLLGGESVTKQ